MRFSRSPADAAIISTLVFPFLAAGNTLDCERVLAGGVSFDLHKLGGPRSVMHSVNEGASWTNTTYTIDICKALKPKGKSGKDERCPGGTRLCAIERFIKDGVDQVKAAYAIAGDLGLSHGKPIDAKWTLLRKSTSNEDSKKEGLSLEIHGGFHTIEGKDKPQKGIVEFICDKDREGLENLITPEDEYDTSMKKREDERKDEKKDVDARDGELKEGESKDNGTSSLQFVSYDPSPEIDILRLNWRTKYACEDSKSEQDGEKKAGWGFFTWFILIAFLSTAAYLIFGSWLNYNRYGARGWDLLPHGDTIRDVPYLLKDWSRRVASSVQGGGSRGGYAAV